MRELLTELLICVLLAVALLVLGFVLVWLWFYVPNVAAGISFLVMVWIVYTQRNNKGGE